MKKLIFVGLLLAFGACRQSAGPETSRARPNFVVILVDDLRWDDVIASPDYADVLEEMKRELDALLE